MRATFLLFGFFMGSFAFADVNPFMAVRDRYQWAIEQIIEHKVPDESQV
ncbi:MAG TPA: hypothetical protein VIJ93_05335 [bacterium]